MSSEMRPGGLTALAVINFVFGGLGVLGAFGMAALPMVRVMARNSAQGPTPPEVEALLEIGVGLLLLIAAANLVIAVLGIVSGIGYLKLKKFLGRVLGNAYAVLSILIAIPMMWLPSVLGGGFNLFAILNFLYPALTLFLLNVTFREDFVN